MCFSVEASFGASALLGAFGIAGVWKAKTPAQKTFWSNSFGVFHSTVWRRNSLAITYASKLCNVADAGHLFFPGCCPGDMARLGAISCNAFGKRQKTQ